MVHRSGGAIYLIFEATSESPRGSDKRDAHSEQVYGPICPGVTFQLHMSGL